MYTPKCIDTYPKVSCFLYIYSTSTMYTPICKDTYPKVSCIVV